MTAKRLAAAGFAAVCALSVSLPAHAATDPTATAAAAGHVAAQIVGGDHVPSAWGAVSVTADAVLALAAAADPGYDDEIAAMVGYLKANAAGYVGGNPEGAAKLAIVAATTGASATDFGGSDLIAGVRAGIGADGAFGSWPGPYAQGLGVVALARNDEAVPASMITWLTESDYRNSDGGYAFDAAGPSDGDSTGMALLGLLAVPSPSCAVTEAILDAKAWAAANQDAAGYWAGYSPANTTGVLGSALQASGTSETGALAWLAGQQLADGGLPASPGGSTSDFLATTQAIFLLAGTSYLDVPAKSPYRVVGELPSTCASATPPAPTPTVTVTRTATAARTVTARVTATVTATPRVSAAVTAAPAVTATVTATPTVPTIPAPTPAAAATTPAATPATAPWTAGGDWLVFPASLGAGALLAGGTVWLLRRRLP